MTDVNQPAKNPIDLNLVRQKYGYFTVSDTKGQSIDFEIKPALFGLAYSKDILTTNCNNNSKKPVTTISEHDNGLLSLPRTNDISSVIRGAMNRTTYSEGAASAAALSVKDMLTTGADGLMTKKFHVTGASPLDELCTPAGLKALHHEGNVVRLQK